MTLTKKFKAVCSELRRSPDGNVIHVNSGDKRNTEANNCAF